jgi:hypothetical protein
LPFWGREGWKNRSLWDAIKNMISLVQRQLEVFLQQD